MEDLENVSELDIKIALIDAEDPQEKGIHYNDDGWVLIKEVTALSFDNRPLPPKIYPSLKN